MKLLFFALLCVITILIIRSIQRGTPPRTPLGGAPPSAGPRRGGSRRGKPVVPPDEIIDVSFKDFDEPGTKPPEGS